MSVSQCTRCTPELTCSACQSLDAALRANLRDADGAPNWNSIRPELDSIRSQYARFCYCQQNSSYELQGYKCPYCLAGEKHVETFKRAWLAEQDGRPFCGTIPKYCACNNVLGRCKFCIEAFRKAADSAAVSAATEMPEHQGCEQTEQEVQEQAPEVQDQAPAQQEHGVEEQDVLEQRSLKLKEILEKRRAQRQQPAADTAPAARKSFARPENVLESSQYVPAPHVARTDDDDYYVPQQASPKPAKPMPTRMQQAD